MRKIVSIIISMLSCVYFPTLTLASGLIPEQCSIGDRPLDGPLEMVYMSFDGGIELSQNAKAYVTKGNEQVANAISFEVRNDTYERTQGWLYMYFSGECLPIGEEYVLCLEAGSIFLSDDREVTNNDIALPFQIPSDLGVASFSYEDGCEIESTYSISCSWRHEASAIGNPKWKLYREGKLVREYPADINSDWDLGSAFLIFKEKMHFEKNINYRLVLPEGSVCTHRTDIVNKEAIFDFTGGYTNPIQSPNYYWCSLFNELPDKIYEVSFYYNMPIELIKDKPIVLSEAYQPKNQQWQAMPTLSYDSEKWILTANFGGIEIDHNKVYTVEIPEGTVVTAQGDISVNPTQSTVCGGMSNLSEPEVNDCIVKVRGKSIHASGVRPCDYITISDSKGRIIRSFNNPSDIVDIEMDNSGIYIVVIGTKTFKVVIP